MVAMKALKYLSFVGKIAGLVSALNVIPFMDPKVGVIVFAAASIIKDTVNRIGDLMDDGKPNASFKA
jgi:membrane protein implicated in regulation of membrane protease activity